MSLTAAALLPTLRILVYNPSQETISDETMTTIVQGWIDVFGDDDANKCLVLWNSLISILEFLWNTDMINHATTTGGATSRMEKVGQVQVQVEYDNGSTSYTSPWENIYTNYLNGTLQIPGCAIANGVSSKVLIGGVSANEINRVNSNPDSVNGLGDVASVDRRNRNVDWERRNRPYFPGRFR